MCGITGVIDFGHIGESEINVVEKMNEALLHRGPDAKGIWRDDNVVFGHVRLSIIDLSEASNQPMLDVFEELVIVFNGEIYNQEELREELERDFRFKTDHSDTEVILNAYKKWGIDALQRFVGMFAIALYDKRLKKIFLIRDRFGQKPLFWTQQGGKIYFSSENQAFFHADILKKELNEEAIYHYLSFLTVPAPQSFFKDVSKVEAGYYYEFSQNGIKKERYWDIAEAINREERSRFSEAQERTKALLDEAMRYRNVSDVPISIALSGGLDSSLNLHYTKANRSDQIATITIAYEKTSRFDESTIARRYSEELGVLHIPKTISQEDFLRWIDEYLAIAKDVPTGDPNTALMYGISKIAKEHDFKVLLVGEGGDEIGGYAIYDKLLFLNKTFRMLPEMLPDFLADLPLPAKWSKRLHSIIDNPIYARRFIFGFSEREKASFWQGEKNFNSYEIIERYMDEISDDFSDSFLRKILNVEYKLRLAELLLPRVDYPSMAVSIEARSPFMDHRLIEYSASLPWKLKMKRGPKTIIKSIAKKQLPSYILKAPKVGFGMLLTPFLKEIMPRWFEETLLSSNAPLQEFVSKEFLQELATKHAKSKSYGYQLWVLYSLNKWLLNNQS